MQLHNVELGVRIQFTEVFYVELEVILQWVWLGNNVQLQLVSLGVRLQLTTVAFVVMLQCVKLG